MKNILLAMLLFTAAGSFAQTADQNEIISKLANAPGKTDTDFYMFEAYGNGDITLLDGAVLRSVSFRVNLQRNTLEIMDGQTVKTLQANRINSFTLDAGSGASTFMNLADLKHEGKNLVGFGKILGSGTYKLLELVVAELKAGNYNARVDAGAQQARVVKSERYFLAKDKVAIEADVTKKKLKGEFQKTFNEDITSMLESLDVNPKKKEDLVKLTENLNGKSSSQQAVGGKQE